MSTNRKRSLLLSLLFLWAALSNALTVSAQAAFQYGSVRFTDSHDRTTMRIKRRRPTNLPSGYTHL
jgi:hypothetical protein